MQLLFTDAILADVAALVDLHRAVAEDLTRQYGQGHWSPSPREGGVRMGLRNPKFSRIILATLDGRLAGTFHLQTKKPWAIDVAYFTPCRRPLYLTGMAVAPDMQRRGIGRALMHEAERMALAWPADAIRLDAFDAIVGAGPFYAKCGYREVAHVIYKQDPLIYFERLMT